ncbi:hypothetical protein [Flavobacterium jumunjinense]|uniref:Uncharacterized protein n=1 Tax=Flavobacterium jumunjinense TaxID=998845 RepID=A0ABV5GQL4_9FLAO
MSHKQTLKKHIPIYSNEIDFNSEELTKAQNAYQTELWILLNNINFS